MSDFYLALVQLLIPFTVSNSIAEAWSGESKQEVNSKDRVGGRGANTNHPQRGETRALMWVRQVLQLPAVGGRMPTEPGMHKQSTDV